MTAKRTKAEVDAEIASLKTDFDNLTIDKKRHELGLGLTRDTIRKGGWMPAQKYADCCAAQAQHKAGIVAVERKMADIRGRIRSLSLTEPNPAKQAERAERHERGQSLVARLAVIRDEYQSFTADKSRVASMRAMAGEFAQKLTAIIRDEISVKRQMEEAE